MPVSDAESEIMQVLWHKSPVTADQIGDVVCGRQQWSIGTVKTLLNRLLKKGAISAERDGRRYLYRPLLSKEDYLFDESQGLLDRLFDGRLAPLVNHFSERKGLSAEDIASLKRLIQELDDD